jgi:hypothetical protein
VVYQTRSEVIVSCILISKRKYPLLRGFETRCKFDGKLCKGMAYPLLIDVLPFNVTVMKDGGNTPHYSHWAIYSTDSR